MRHVALTALALFVVGNAASADPYVTSKYTALQSGSYKLDFVVHADLYHGDCFEWGLLSTGISDLVAPYRWTAGSDFRRTWWSTVLPSQWVIHPGGVLYGSSGTFPVLPAQLDYYVLTTLGYGAHYGTVVPVAIPEPPSLLALCAGIGAMGAAIRRRQR